MSKLLVDKHLKKFDANQRAILSNLREMISDELPTAVEVIKYGIPTFVVEGIPVLGFDGYLKHNSIFPYCGSTNLLLKAELANYVQTKGSIHFAIDKRFPKPLLRKIIKAKISQINSAYPNKKGEYLEFYANGVLKAAGRMKNEKMHGDWKWFRKNGILMRSGSFNLGKQIGIWITYDQKGKPYKKSNFGV